MHLFADDTILSLDKTTQHSETYEEAHLLGQKGYHSATIIHIILC